MYSNEQKAKFTLAGVAVGASVLALVSFGLVSYQPEAMQAIRVVEVTMSLLLLFGIFGAEVRHKAPILLAWLIATISYCCAILFVLENAYIGEVFFIIITDILLVGGMYIVYRAYCQLDQETYNLGWTDTTYPANIGLYFKSVDLKAKEEKQNVMAKPPSYEEQQNVPN